MIDKFARQTYCDALASEIREVMAQDDLPTSQAAQRVIANKLGYVLDEVEFVDGAGDRGIDFWYSSDGGIYIYQVKTHELTEDGRLALFPFDNEGVLGLKRAKDFLLGDTSIPANHRLANLTETFYRVVRNHKSQESDSPIHIHLSLVILGEGLTEQAHDELADFEKSLGNQEQYDGIPLVFYLGYYDVDNVINIGWREENREWKDISGKKRNTINLTPMRQSERQHYINDNKSALFYCRAIDLVNAYEEFGYQIFEPNVRANLKDSKVNKKIEESASYHSSMREFRFLNNGVAIICTNYKLPAGQRPSFEVQEPGVVNGLQTVVSLHKAYQALTQEDRVYCL